jgi:hypothetical protein
VVNDPHDCPDAFVLAHHTGFSGQENRFPLSAGHGPDNHATSFQIGLG